MPEIVTYKNSGRMCFCQIRYENGERVLVSISGGTNPCVDIRRLGFLGLFPKDSIWKFSVSDAGSPDDYVRKLALMFPEALENLANPLDAFRDLLLSCSSICDAKRELENRQGG